MRCMLCGKALEHCSSQSIPVTVLAERYEYEYRLIRLKYYKMYEFHVINGSTYIVRDSACDEMSTGYYCYYYN